MILVDVGGGIGRRLLLVERTCCGGAGAVVADSGFACGDRGGLVHGTCTPLESPIRPNKMFLFSSSRCRQHGSMVIRVPLPNDLRRRFT